MKTTIIMLSISFLMVMAPSSQAAKVDPAVLKAIEDIAKLDGNNDSIEPGKETEALVRYVNDKLMKKYDTDHSGTISGPETQAFFEGQGKELSESALDDVYTKAYEKAESKFKGGVDISNPKALLNKVPRVSRTQGFDFGLAYTEKSETNKDTKTFEGSIEYKWGFYTLVGMDYAVGTKLSYSNEDTFIVNNISDVERWTLQPFKVTLGNNNWFAKPTIGLGVARTEEKTIVNDVLSIEKGTDFVWEFGFDFPIKWPDGKPGNHSDPLVATLTLTNTVRFENLASGRKNDELKFGFKIGYKEFKEIRKLITGK